MQGFDILLGGLGYVLTICAALLLADVILRRRQAKENKAFLAEVLAESRIENLQGQLKTQSLSHAWRWFYRYGHRKGRKKGKEEGISEGMQRAQRIEVLNRCVPHGADLHPQLVRLYNGQYVQAWFCTNWEAHTVNVETDKIAHPFAAARFLAQKEMQGHLLPLTETQEIPTVPKPKKVKLSS